METGSLIYYKGEPYSPVDSAIKLGEWLEDGEGKYSHICVYIGNGQIAEAQGGRLTGPASFESYKNNCDIGEFRWTSEQSRAIVSVAQKYYGLKYNWAEIAVIGIEDLTGIQLPLHIHHQFICSEYVKRVIKEATGVLLSDKRFTTPEDISLYPKQCITVYSKR